MDRPGLEGRQPVAGYRDAGGDHLRIKQYFLDEEPRRVRSNLPPRPANFVGRSRELVRLKTMLSEPHPFVTVVGLAGIGKTTLALETAHRLARQGLFTDGIIWIDGRRLTSHNSILDQLGTFLGIPAIFDKSMEDKERLILAQVSDRDRLLVFDNFESVVTDLRELVQFIRRLPCAVLVTSRDWLLTSDEPMRLDAMPPGDALSLFQEVSGFADADMTPDVRTLCMDELEGHPLAIEVVAAQARLISVQDILIFVHERPMEALEQDPWTALEPLSVVKAIDYSYDHLSPDAQRLLTACSVFHGDFGLDEAQAVSELPRVACRRRLQELSSRSLIQLSHDRRFRLHGVTRKYGYARLSDPRPFHRRAADYFLSLAPPDHVSAAEQWFDAGESQQALCLIIEQRDRLIDDGQGSRALELLAVLDDTDFPTEQRFDLLASRVVLYDLPGMRAQQHADIDGGLALAQELGDGVQRVRWYIRRSRVCRETHSYDDALEAAQAALRAAEAIGELGDRIAANRELGLVLWRRSAYDGAIAQFEQAFELCRTSDTCDLLPALLNDLGRTFREQGEFQAAIAHHQRAQEAAREQGASDEEQQALLAMGVIYCARLNEYPRALTLFLQALELCRAQARGSAEAAVLNWLGITSLNMGDHHRALGFYEEALQAAKRTGNRYHEGALLNNLGELERLLGRSEQALTHYGRGLTIAREIEHVALELVLLWEVGSALAELGRLDEALAHQQAALTVAEGIGEEHKLATGHNYLAEAYQQKGSERDQSAALDHTRRAVAYARQVNLYEEEIRGLSLQALAHLGLGDIDAALEASAAAIALLDEQEDLRSPEQFWFHRAQVLMANGQEAEARDFLQRAHDRVMEKAERLESEGVRRAFLGTTLNRAIIRSFRDRLALRLRMLS